MRRLSLNARTAHEAEATDETDVVLIRITHPALAEPVRLSTDPTERITIDPLSYGTRSTWLSEAGAAVHAFVLLDAVMPGDQDDTPHTAQFMAELVDNDLARLLRSFHDRARFDIAVVKALSPNFVEAEYRDLSLTIADGDFGQVRLTVSQEELATEPCPAGRFTKLGFPGLFP